MRPVLLTCLASALIVAPASAAPIRVTIEGKSELFLTHPQDRIHEEGILGQFILPDDVLRQGGEFSLGPPSAFEPHDYAWAEVLLTFDRLTDGPPAAGSPAILLRSTLSGEYEILRNGVRGSWDSMWVWSSLERGDPDADIPQELLNLFLDPDAVTIESSTTADSFSGPRRSSVLRVTPATVPEPSTLAAWSAVGLAALAIRRRRCTSATKAPTIS